MMAYDLEEQEQLDQIKAFWAKWGNLLTWAATAMALAFAAYYGYKYYQRSQTQAAAPMYEQLEKAATAAATDSKDAKNVQLALDLANTLTTQYGRTPYAQMGALLAAKVQSDAGQSAPAQTLLTWVMDKAVDAEYQHIARSRLAAVLLDAKKPAEALALLPETAPKGFEALYADRRGDALAASGKKDLAVAEYQKAWTSAPENAALREVVEQKLIMLGANTPAAKLAPKANADTK